EDARERAARGLVHGLRHPAERLHALEGVHDDEVGRDSGEVALLRDDLDGLAWHRRCEAAPSARRREAPSWRASEAGPCPTKSRSPPRRRTRWGACAEGAGPARAWRAPATARRPRATPRSSPASRPPAPRGARAAGPSTARTARSPPSPWTSMQ